MNKEEEHEIQAHLDMENAIDEPHAGAEKMECAIAVFSMSVCVHR